MEKLLDRDPIVLALALAVGLVWIIWKLVDMVLVKKRKDKACAYPECGAGRGAAAMKALESKVTKNGNEQDAMTLQVSRLTFSMGRVQTDTAEMRIEVRDLTRKFDELSGFLKAKFEGM